MAHSVPVQWPLVSRDVMVPTLKTHEFAEYRSQVGSRNQAVQGGPVTAEAARAQVEDRLHRPLHDLRISVTDRCNFRCTYCMPRDVFGPDYQFLDRSELLRYEE